MSTQAETAVFIKTECELHECTLRRQAVGEKVTQSDLREAILYFKEGAGQGQKKPCCWHVWVSAHKAAGLPVGSFLNTEFLPC